MFIVFPRMPTYHVGGAKTLSAAALPVCPHQCFMLSLHSHPELRSRWVPEPWRSATVSASMLISGDFPRIRCNSFPNHSIYPLLTVDRNPIKRGPQPHEDSQGCTS